MAGDAIRVAVHPADSGLSGACGLNRLVWPAEALADDPNLDISIGSRLQAVRENGVFGDRAIGVRTNADVIVLQRPLRRELVEVIPVIQRSGVAVCVEVDDDFHALPKGHPGRRAWAPMSDPNRNWRWLAEACRLADLVTCTTPALADRYAPHGRCVVLPNCVPDWYLDVEGDRSEQPTLTWTGTPITHTGDLEMLGDSVKRAVVATGAQFLAIGSTSTLDILDVPGEVVEWSPLTDRGPKGYPRQVARADVGIVPLVDSKFTRAKSALKMMEYAALGVVPVVSPSPDNLRMARLGIGRFAETRADWVEQLSPLLRSRGMREELAGRGREIMRSWTYEARSGEWGAAWTLAFANRKAAVAA